MFRLIKNELFKIFHKLSTYVLLAIVLLFIIVTNLLYRYYDEPETIYDEIDIAAVSDYINNYNPTTDSLDDYAYNLALYDSYNLAKKYDIDSWQYNIFMNEYLNINTEYYRIVNTAPVDEERVTELNNSLLAILQAIYQDNWRYFAESEKSNLEDQLTEYQESLSTPNISNIEISQYKKQIYITEQRLELINYRLEEDVCYGDDYLNEAIENIENSLYGMAEYMYDLGADREEYASVLKTYHENKYILSEKLDTNNDNTLRSVIINFFDEYSFLIVVFIIMIAGSIVSDEFSRGTIKALLTVPHSRSKILTAKFLTAIICIPFIILFIFLGEMLIGGIFLGFDSLNIPAVVYNISTNSLDVLNVFVYFLLYVLATLPELILLIALAFTCSIILNSTAFAIAITFCAMIASQIINNIAYVYDIGILDYFFTTNWDFTQFLFGGSSMFGLTIGHSLMVCFTYLVLFLLVSYTVFVNKDVKNI